MSSKEPQQKKASVKKATTPQPPPVADTTTDESELEQEQDGKSHRELIASLLNTMQKKLGGGNQAKVSVADYIRLLQLHADMEDELPREIEVRWIETPAESSTDETSSTARSPRKRDSTQ